ncbi:hypothetical protein A0H81_01993 [Grifola frondosa]|uniref:Uncharacterized protein n=1 Tax=Grifola frondosa TaxID=5627 RepID=A0A1C7MMM7_GRIFR|nr:hypothetical protein A0H81_01993 [Grifola frondosa]
MSIDVGKRTQRAEFAELDKKAARLLKGYQIRPDVKASGYVAFAMQWWQDLYELHLQAHNLRKKENATWLYPGLLLSAVTHASVAQASDKEVNIEVLSADDPAIQDSPLLRHEVPDGTSTETIDASTSALIEPPVAPKATLPAVQSKAPTVEVPMNVDSPAVKPTGKEPPVAVPPTAHAEVAIPAAKATDKTPITTTTVQTADTPVVDVAAETAIAQSNATAAALLKLNFKKTGGGNIARTVTEGAAKSTPVNLKRSGPEQMPGGGHSKKPRMMVASPGVGISRPPAGKGKVREEDVEMANAEEPDEEDEAAGNEPATDVKIRRPRKTTAGKMTASKPPAGKGKGREEDVEMEETEEVEEDEDAPGDEPATEVKIRRPRKKTSCKKTTPKSPAIVPDEEGEEEEDDGKPVLFKVSEFECTACNTEKVPCYIQTTRATSCGYCRALRQRLTRLAGSPPKRFKTLSKTKHDLNVRRAGESLPELDETYVEYYRKGIRKLKDQKTTGAAKTPAPPKTPAPAKSRKTAKPVSRVNAAYVLVPLIADAGSSKVTAGKPSTTLPSPPPIIKMNPQTGKTTPNLPVRLFNILAQDDEETPDEGSDGEMTTEGESTMPNAERALVLASADTDRQIRTLITADVVAALEQQFQQVFAMSAKVDTIATQVAGLSHLPTQVAEMRGDVGEIKQQLADVHAGQNKTLEFLQLERVLTERQQQTSAQRNAGVETLMESMRQQLIALQPSAAASLTALPGLIQPMNTGMANSGTPAGGGPSGAAVAGQKAGGEMTGEGQGGAPAKDSDNQAEK